MNDSIFGGLRELWPWRRNGEEATEETFRPAPKKRSSLLRFHPTGEADVMIYIRTPASLEDSREAAEDLKHDQAVLINLDGVEDDLCQRIVDFVSGVTYALDGDMHKVADRTFLFAPPRVALTPEVRSRVAQQAAYGS